MTNHNNTFSRRAFAGSALALGAFAATGVVAKIAPNGA